MKEYTKKEFWTKYQEGVAPRKVVKEDTRAFFKNSIREQQNNPVNVRLRQAYENNEVKPEDMSYNQILTLNRLYKKQIKKIDEELNMKKININLLQKKMSN